MSAVILPVLQCPLFAVQRMIGKPRPDYEGHGAAVRQDVDVKDTQPLEDDMDATGQKVSAQAAADDESKPHAPVAHLQSDRHPATATAEDQQGASSHPVGEEAHPRGSTAGFQSDRKHSQSAPSTTHHKRPSRGAVIGEELDERAVTADAGRPAKRPRHSHADGSNHSRGREGSPTASGPASQGRSSSQDNSQAGETTGQVSIAAASPEASQKGHHGRRHAGEAVSDQRQGVPETNVLVGSHSPSPDPLATRHLAQQQQQQSAGSYSSSDSDSDASKSPPLPLPSWRQQEQQEPEQAAPRVTGASPSAWEGAPPLLPNQSPVSPSQKHYRNQHNPDGRQEGRSNGADRAVLRSASGYDRRRSDDPARHSRSGSDRPARLPDTQQRHDSGEDQYQQAHRYQPNPSPAERSVHRRMPMDQHPSLSQEPNQAPYRSFQQPRRPFTRDAGPLRQPGSREEPSSHPARGWTPQGNQDRPGGPDRGQRHLDSRDRSGTPSARGYPSTAAEGRQSAQGRQPPPAAAMHRPSDRSGGFDRGYNSQRQMHAPTRNVRADVQGSLEHDRTGRQAYRHEVNNREGHHSNSMVSPPSRSDIVGERIGHEHRQLGGRHAVPQAEHR